MARLFGTLRSSLIAICTVSCVGLASAGDRTGILTDAPDWAGLSSGEREVAPVSDKARAAIISLADAALAEPVLPIASGKENGERLAPSGNPQDYVSLSPYWWPNPETEDGLPYIRRDGKTNPDRFEYDTPKIARLSRLVRQLAQGYVLTGNEAYAEKAAEHLRVWFIDPATRMNPSLRFAQFVPGVADGRCFGLIDTLRFRWIPDSVLMIEGSGSWSGDDTDAVRGWFSDYADWLMTSELGQEERAQPNNHGTWFKTQVMQYLVFAGRESEVRGLMDEMKALMNEQFEPDGAQPLERARTRSLHYYGFNIRGYLDAVRYGRAAGVDLASHVTERGASLRTALDHAAPFYVDPDSWPHETIGGFAMELAYQMFRNAARIYDDERYEIAARALPAMEEDALWIDVMIPPVHEPTRGIDTVDWGVRPE